MPTTENNLEQALIDQLADLKYTYRKDICDRAALEQNFRAKFEALNHVQLTDSEFSRLLTEIVSGDVFKAAKTLREPNSFEREDGTPLFYTLVNIKDWCKNDFEVINQTRINTRNSHQRYDVILLINGVPVVQIELKRIGINPRLAMKQIIDYKNDPGNGYTNTLLCFMQLFIISNRDATYYFSNNRNQHFKFEVEEQFLPIYQFADQDNKKINDLQDFTNQFLAKCHLGQMISRYMVLIETEKKLMIMRPYQVYAVRAIVDCIDQNRGNGYIWHTTGSGKTLTSFKTATLLKDNPAIDKCLFVVDRKDLDRQTREEFNRFQENCVEQNTNTETLVRRLLSDDYADKVIVTTIQKLGLALDDTNKRSKKYQQKGKQTYKERLEPLQDRRMVFIFDECHRSQFGDNHQAIKNFFPNAQLFGFTGTPIFAQNANHYEIDGTQKTLKTTNAIFQQQLHAYTITHAIEDDNVLRFHVDYFKSKANDDTTSDPSKEAIVDEILANHNKATNQRRFNAIFATGGIDQAIDYYRLFKTRQDSDQQPLNIACVFSPPASGNQDVKQLQEDLQQEEADNKKNPKEKQRALQQIIADYNGQYGTNHHVAEFDQYYQDIQQRIKDHKYPNADYSHQKKIDIVIVVDMLLTGFDSQYLNTLYVHKKLKYHGLIQAFSRTNRVLNNTKPHGQIKDFCNQQAAVDEAIILFSGENSERAKQIWLVEPASDVITQYEETIAKFQTFMQSQGLAFEPSAVHNLKGDTARAEFINHYKPIQRLKTQLDQYTDLSEEQSKHIDACLSDDTQQGFRGEYLRTAKQLRALQGQGGDTPELQQLDFELVLFASALIDYDYIMELITNVTQAPPDQQTMNREQLFSLLNADASLIDDRDSMMAYIRNLPIGQGMDKQAIQKGYELFKAQKANDEVAALAAKHSLESAALQEFMDLILWRHSVDGFKLTELMIPLDLAWSDRVAAEQALMKELIPLLKKRTKRDISGLSAYDN